MATRDDLNVNDRDANEDPITGAPGAHPIGAGLGAAVGGAAAGAAAGTVAGPIGTVVGTVAGGLAGGLAGKEIAERIEPTVEAEYWQHEYPNREYFDDSVSYDEIGPAYRYGWESRERHQDRPWDEAEPSLESEWMAHRASSSLDWPRARPAARDAWERVDVAAMRGAGEPTREDATGKQDPTARRAPK